MKRAFIGFAAALALAVPAAAQTGSSTSNPGSNGSQTSTGSTMSSSQGTQSCQSMMDQSLSQGEMRTTPAMKREMDLAKQAQAKGDEQGCMMHMRKAMGGSQ